MRCFYIMVHEIIHRNEKSIYAFGDSKEVKVETGAYAAKTGCCDSAFGQLSSICIGKYIIESNVFDFGPSLNRKCALGKV